MGSSSSRLRLRSPRSQRPTRTKPAFLASLLICGCSTTHAPVEMEDDPAEFLVNSGEHNDPVVDKFRSPTKESAWTSDTATGSTGLKTETGTSSEISIVTSNNSSSEHGSGNVEMNTQQKCLSESKELVIPHQLRAANSNASITHQLSATNQISDTASTSYEDSPSKDLVSADGRATMDAVDHNDNIINKDGYQNSSGGIESTSPFSQGLGGSNSDGVSVENHVSEVMAVHSSDSGSASIVSRSSVTSHSIRDETPQETMPSDLGFLVSERERHLREGNVLHVDVVSISSNILSSNTSEISNHEARQNSRRLFWDAFSRRSSRRHSDSRTFVFSTDDTDDLGSHDRWLLDFSDDFFDDAAGSDSGYLGSRTHSLNERRWHSRSEIWETLRSGLNGSGSRTTICPSGLHPAGTCSCESIVMAEESGTHASISRIVMLAEALFEVLDEIHRQPVSLALSMVSLPAPDSVVDSFPIKDHRKPDKHESGDDVAQCYICLAEYEEGDKIRVLPCHHEYHMLCVDKWLKEIHGVCPLCRGDVREGLTDGSVLNSGTPSFP